MLKICYNFPRTAQYSCLSSSYVALYGFVSLQKSKLMFKRLDASTLPEDILSNTQPLPMMAHSAGSALWVSKCVQKNCCVSVPLRLCRLTVSPYRTRGGFVALSPISPQELFLQPMSSDVDASQQQNLVRQSMLRPCFSLKLIHFLDTRFLVCLSFFC